MVLFSICAISKQLMTTCTVVTLLKQQQQQQQQQQTQGAGEAMPQGLINIHECCCPSKLVGAHRVQKPVAACCTGCRFLQYSSIYVFIMHCVLHLAMHGALG